jgi:sortase A
VRQRRLALLLSLLITGSGIVLLGGQAWLRAKAVLAAVLIDRAWAAHLEDGREHRPWPWADLHPVARIDIPRLGVRRAVLSGASGPSLAFGLSHVSGTALPGEPGNIAIAGHRDSWAAFMRDLRPGDEIRLETRSAGQRYTVRDLEVLPQGRIDVVDRAGEDRLTLITCYPFGGLLRSRWRLVIVATPCNVVPRVWHSRDG